MPVGKPNNKNSNQEQQALSLITSNKAFLRAYQILSDNGKRGTIEIVFDDRGNLIFARPKLSFSACEDTKEPKTRGVYNS